MHLVPQHLTIRLVIFLVPLFYPPLVTLTPVAMSVFGGAFGQPSSAFGAPSNSAFGAPGAFGQSSQSAFSASAFGAPSGGLFGASAQQQQNSAFGSFGQSSTPFGSSPVFGASAPVFGASGAFGSSVFGAQSGSAFGNAGAFGASQPAFGSGGGVFGGGGGGSSLFGSANAGGAFGSSGSTFDRSQSAWGASSPNVLGGSSAFGATGSSGIFSDTGAGSSLFGNQNSSGFGGSANQAQNGTAGVQWQITTEYDSGNPTAASKYHSITMMPALREKSLEELRFEDYIMGNKGGNAPGTGNTLFGQGAPSTGLFGSGVPGSAFGNTSAGGFGASTSGFNQQGGAFGASSGGGLFGGSSVFGNTGGTFGQSSSNAFGSAGAGFGQSGGGLFGHQSGGGFGAQSSSGFVSGFNAFGSSGSGSAPNLFGSGGGGFGSGTTGFGTGSGGFSSNGSGFGNGGGSGSASGFGSSSFGSTSFGNSGPGSSGFENSGFGGNSQTGGNILFGQSGNNNLFGGSQPQTSSFSVPAQSGSGLFGSGSSSSATLFDSSTAGAKPPFASSTPVVGFGTPGSNGGLFGNTGTGFGQSSLGAGSGFGGGFGIQPNQQQNAQPSLFGNPSGQVAINAPNLAQNPPVGNTLNAIMQGNGGTVAPLGANYGTVLHNLQMIKGEIEQQKRLAEQQVKANAQNAHQNESISVVMLPPPPLVKLSANWIGSDYSWANRNQRTKMRSVVGKLGGVTSKISGTPLKFSGMATQSESATLSTLSTSDFSVRKMPFFAPQQFTGPKRRLLRSSEMTTSHQSTKTLLPVPDTISKAFRPKPGSGVEQMGSRMKSPTGLVPDDHQEGNLSNDVDRAINSTSAPNGRADLLTSDNNVIDPREDIGGRRGERMNEVEAKKSEDKRHSGINSTDEEFMWSSKRPSTWSLKRSVNSEAQFNPSEYLPFQTRDGFYTVPSLSELATMTMKELQAVEGFTVGRDGYGEIKWVEPVDVRGLDLDNVVDIQRGEVAVYPDRDAYQLDSPAVVTLIGMYKKDKRTGEPTDDKQQIAKYASRLEAFCEVNNLRFIEYNPENGHWKFEASTFSRD